MSRSSKLTLRCLRSGVPGMIYAVVSLALVLWTNVYITCPAVYGAVRCESTTIFGYLCVAQVLLNAALFHYRARYNHSSWYLSERLRDHLKTRPTEADRPPNGGSAAARNVSLKFCRSCEAQVFACCHHCPVCDFCVMRRDHHCFFLGGCVGFANQRNFVVFLFWTLIGASYAGFLSLKYLNMYYTPLSLYGLSDYLLPVAVTKWLLFNDFDGDLLGVLAQLYFCASGLFGSALFFFLQCYLIMRGQTMWQYFKNDYSYVVGNSLSNKLAAVFGTYWAGNFLLPLPFHTRIDDHCNAFLYGSVVKTL